MSGFPKFTKVVVAYYCHDCKVEVPVDKWRSHAHTKVHRMNSRGSR